MYYKNDGRKEITMEVSKVQNAKANPNFGLLKVKVPNKQNAIEDWLAFLRMEHKIYIPCNKLEMSNGISTSNQVQLIIHSRKGTRIEQSILDLARKIGYFAKNINSNEARKIEKPFS